MHMMISTTKTGFLLATLAAAMAMVPSPAAAKDEACTKPVLINRPNLSAQELNSIMQQAQAYVTCMSKAIEVQRAQADESLTRARTEAEKSNAMVTDINSFITEVKAYQAEHNEK